MCPKFLAEAGWLFGDHRLCLTARGNSPQLMQPVTKMPPKVSERIGLLSNLPENFGTWTHTPNLAYTASSSNRQKHRQNPHIRRCRMFFNLLVQPHKPAYKIGTKIGKNAYENGH